MVTRINYLPQMKKKYYTWLTAFSLWSFLNLKF
uniref:Uncharacterized protein n=1 Tax=Anguilla anguilla TaxID=7936 RepID=A0A0E9W7K4_ANGAN